MQADRIINGWIMVVVFLVAIIAVGSAVAWSRYTPSKAIEISVVPEPELQGEIYVGGEVNNAGLYPLKAGDSIEDIIRAAGGVTDRADLSRLILHVSAPTQEEAPQKVDINRAEAWLLAALPGIGEVRAQAIIEYRQRNGPFRNTNELVEVEGIGLATYEKIKHLVTVTE